jgi:hypothetical protein
VQAVAAASAAPGEQATRVTTELPEVQTPDPFAISPSGTRIGDSYFNLTSAFLFDISCISFMFTAEFKPFLNFVKKHILYQLCVTELSVFDIK